MINNYSIDNSQTISIEQFYKCGIEGLCISHYCKEYDDMMSSIRNKFPAIKYLIGVLPIFESQGSGWALNLKFIGNSYGLTFKGIREVLNLIGLKNVVVTESKEQLKQAFCNMNCSKAAFITDSKAFESEFLADIDSSHVVSAFVEKQGNIFRIFINDSLGTDYEYDDIKAIIPEGYKLELITALIKRQHNDEETCNTFAITDCEAFFKNANLLTQMNNMKTLNKYHTNKAVMNKLPDDLMTLDKSEVARRKTIDFQALLLRLNHVPLLRDEATNSKISKNDCSFFYKSSDQKADDFGEKLINRPNV